MRIVPTALPGVMIVEIAPSADARGLFARTYDEESFAAGGLSTSWPQASTSWSERRGTLRGLHYQVAPRAEAKLIRCTQGRIFDVAVDLRPASPTFRRWTAVELSAQRRNALYIPAGCAHGFLTLEDGCEVYYQMSECYAPDLARGVRWSDRAFAIAWPFEPSVISERDETWPEFQP